MLLAFLVIAVVGTSVLAATISLSATAVFVLYLWTGLVATMVVPVFWTVLDRSLRVSEAKRVFAAIGAGGVLGAMVGSAAAGGLARIVATHHLVTAGAIAYGVAAICAATAAPRPILDEPEPRRQHAEAWSRRSRRYVQLLIGLGIVSTIALTLGDLVFKRELARALPADQLATGFGAVYAGLNAIGLVVQLVVTPRLLARWGVGGALTVLPMILAATGLGFALTGTMIAIAALKLGDGGLRHSLHRVGTEILYLPVPAAIRDGSKPVADAIGLRGGEAAAALLVFAMGALGSNARALAAVAAAAAAAWLVGIAIVRRAYVAQFRDTLRDGEILRDVRIPDLDAESIEMLIESLSSPEEGEAIAALDLLAWRRQLPALVLYHPRENVVRHALSLLEGRLRPDVARVLGHLLDHADPRVRAAALAASARTGSHHERLVAAVADDDPDVRSVALVHLAGDPACAERAAIGIATLVAGSTADRSALARALEYAPSEQFRVLFHELLARREPAVVRHVLHALTRAPGLTELERLLGLLEDPHVRGDVRRVFAAAGQRGLECLIAALDDPRTPLTVRRHLPRTISRFHSRQAADALVARLLREPDSTTEYKILRALGRMRVDDANLEIDEPAIREYARRAIADAARYVTLHDCLDAAPDPSAGAHLIAELLHEKHAAAVERAFRALGIAEPGAGLRSVHDAIMSEDETRCSAAREIIETLVPAELRGPVLAVIEPLTPEARRARLGDLAMGPFASYELFVTALLADPSESLRCVVAYHVAERGLVGLRKELIRHRPLGGPPLVIYAFDQAIARLDV